MSGALDVKRLAGRAAAGVTGAVPELLDGYLDLLVTVSANERRLTAAELNGRRVVGRTAAEDGMALGTLVDLYLTATRLAWPHLPLPTGRAREPRTPAILRAVNDAVVALIDGYETAQRSAIRHEEAVRREFIDDLLHGTGSAARLLELASRFGLQLAGAHTVAVAVARQGFADGDERTRRVETSLMSRFTSDNLLVATKEGRLVCVMPGADTDAPTLLAALSRIAAVDRVGVGRPHAGAAGITRSYQEASDALDVAERLGLNAPVLRAADLLVFQVLFRDRTAITDLVAAVLGPLRFARGGPQPLLDTLAAYYEEGNAVAAASRLRIGVRTVTYRLRRVRDLTGFSATDPAQRFTLETAVQGARLLRWPDQPLDDVS